MAVVSGMSRPQIAQSVCHESESGDSGVLVAVEKKGRFILG